MASRYVQYLVDLHVGLGNFVEAGMAQLYQLKLLEWTDGEVESQGIIPAEPERIGKVCFPLLMLEDLVLTFIYV